MRNEISESWRISFSVSLAISSSWFARGPEQFFPAAPSPDAAARSREQNSPGSRVGRRASSQFAGISRRLSGSLQRRGGVLVDRGLAALESDRGGWTAMLVAMAASIAVSLWLTRGTTFWFDEFTLFSGSRGYNITGLLTQHNAQLILLPRLIYATVFKLFGPDY